MLSTVLILWRQWHVGPIGIVQTFQTIGKGLLSRGQRLSWGTGTAIGRVFGHGHWGMTAEVLTALVQFGAEHRVGEESIITRTRLTAVEGVLLSERYWRLSPDWELFTGMGTVINLPYQVEYFAHRQKNGEEAFLFMQDRRYWEIRSAGARVGQLRSQPYPAIETSLLYTKAADLLLFWRRRGSAEGAAAPP